MARQSTAARCLLLLVIAAVAACSDGTSPPAPGVMSISIATQTAGDLQPFTFQLVVDTLDPIDVFSSEATSFHVTGLRPGVHSVELQGLSASCTSGEDLRQITITPADTVIVDFQVQCAPVTGELRVTAVTTGEDLDPDGYVLVYDQTLAFEVAQNASRRLIHVPPGSHVIDIFDIDPNCALTGSSSRDFVATAGVTGTMDLEVQCSAIPAGVPAFLATEPAGDTLPNASGNATPALDIVSVSGGYAPGWFMFTLHFSAPVAAGSLDAANSLFGFVDFDVDESALTGVGAGIDGFGGNAQQGVEFEVSFVSDDAVTAEMYGLNGFLGLVHAIYDADSVTFRIPLDKLGGDDGNLTYSVVVGTKDRPTDIAPNTGSLVAHLPASPRIAHAGISGRLQRSPLHTAPRRVSPWGSWRRWR